MGCVACISCWKKNNSNILYVFTAPLPPYPLPHLTYKNSAILAGIPAGGGGEKNATQRHQHGPLECT